MSSIRPLGKYERFSLARAQTGVAPIVAFTALLPPSVTVEAATVLAAVQALLGRYPLLRCVVAGRTTTKPHFAIKDGLTAAEILDERSQATVEEALSAALEAGRVFDLDAGPLWKVWLSAADGHGRSRLTLAVHHTIADGSGTRNLFAELLSLVRTPAAAEVPKEAASAAASLEDTVDMRLSKFRLAKVVFSEIILPSLPTFLRPAPPLPVFLNHPATAPHLEPSALRLLSLAPSVVAGLKAAGKAHGVPTLHPLLYVAALAALAASVPSPSVPLLRIVGSTPYSLRDPAVHPHCTGNYVCGHTCSDAVASLLPTRFWAHCAAYAQTLSSPATKAYAKEGMGMLSLIPDGELPAAEGKPARTKWEGWIEDKLAKREFGESFEVSNLGVLPATGWELEEVHWTQTASAFVAALQLNPVAVRGGNLTFTLSYRKNAVDEQVVDRFWATYEALLIELAAGGIDDEATFAELVQNRRQLT
ncbi:hypothetical protein JCM10213_007257 [Rhodosporidiobolus nylandii]